MVTCSNCGEEIVSEVNYCPRCGKRLVKNQLYTPWGKPVTGEKEVAIALLLSLLVSGLGSMYAGRALRGLGWFALQFVVVLFNPYGINLFSFFGFGSIVTSMYDWGYDPMVSVASLAVWFVFYLLYIACMMYDAYKSCAINNKLWHQYLGY